MTDITPDQTPATETHTKKSFFDRVVDQSTEAPSVAEKVYVIRPQSGSGTGSMRFALSSFVSLGI